MLIFGQIVDVDPCTMLATVVHRSAHFMSSAEERRRLHFDIDDKVFLFCIRVFKMKVRRQWLICLVFNRLFEIDRASCLFRFVCNR